MSKNKQIELSSIQATAYWWINMIRGKIREIITEKTTDKTKLKFVQIFYYFTEEDWRQLYLQLVNSITEDVNNYVPKGNTINIDAFSQDTAKGGHDRINSEISKAINKSVPDIRIASSSSKDLVIYTNMFGASVWYKSCGMSDLPTKYEPSYVLTGDKNELDFYNQVISTIAIIEQINRDFRSVSLLRKGFCQEYIKLFHSEESLKEIYDRFNDAFDKACDRDIILGRSYKEMYFSHFRDIDLVGLENYMEIAKHYADVILQVRTSIEGNVYTKKLQKNDDTHNK